MQLPFSSLHAIELALGLHMHEQLFTRVKDRVIFKMKFPSLFYAVTLLMRLLQFASAVIVLGLAGLMLQKFDTSKSNLGRFSYTVCVAVFGMIAAPLTLLPRLNVLALTSVDLVMSLMWWAVFGLLFNVSGKKKSNYLDSTWL